MLGRDDDAVHPAARRRAVAGRAADDSLHAREPRAQAPRSCAARTRSSPSAPPSRRTCARARRRSRARGSRSCPTPSTSRRSGPRPPRRAPPLSGPYALYLGKLAPNKGSAISSTVERARPRLAPGDRRRRPGARRASPRRRALRSRRAPDRLDRSGRRRGWLAHASMLIFPSRGPESLSRVLIEASALGVPIAAMNTGGTPDIVDRRRNGPALGHAGGAGRRRAAAADGRSAAPAPRSGGTDPRRARVRRAGGGRADRAALHRARGEDAVRAPLRVAVVARSVFPLHGSAGSSARLRPRRGTSRPRGVDVTLITRTPSGKHGGRRRSIRAISAALRAVPHVSLRRPPRDDRSRSQHRVSVVRERAGRAAWDLVERGRRRHRPRVRRERARIRATRARRAKRAARAQSPGPRGVRRDRSVARAAEARRRICRCDARSWRARARPTA